MSDCELSARLDAALGISRPMLVHPSDFEVADALLARIEALERIAAAARDLIDYEDNPETDEHGQAVYLHWDKKFGALRKALGGGK